MSQNKQDGRNASPSPVPGRGSQGRLNNAINGHPNQASSQNASNNNSFHNTNNHIKNSKSTAQPPSIVSIPKLDLTKIKTPEQNFVKPIVVPSKLQDSIDDTDFDDLSSRQLSQTRMDLIESPIHLHKKENSKSHNFYDYQQTNSTLE